MDLNTDNLFSSDNIDSLLNTIDGLYQLEKTAAPASETAQNQPLLRAEAFTGDLFSTADLEAAGFNDPQINEITLGLEMGVNVPAYAKTCYTWKQMREIRLGMHAGVDTTVYENYLFSADQMRELRMGLLNHVDATLYANLMLSATDMRKIRMELSEAAYRAHPSGYGYHFTDENSGLVIRISDDCMNAYITLPANVSGRFSVTRITKILKQHEITYGLLQDELERFSKECPRDMEVKIAHGSKSELGYDGYYDFYFDKLGTQSPRIKSDGSVDYTHVKVTESVKTGQVLAVYHPARQGMTGSTVTGILLRESSGQDLPPLTGEGFLYDPNSNNYIALYAGNVTYQEDTYSLNVWKSFTIEGDATRYSGSTEYDGTVLVKGDVRNMARIKASGDIIIEGTVEGAELFAGHNIVVKSGVNAAGKGLIQAQGSISGSFFESANLISGGPIEGNYFLGCNIKTDDKVLARGGKSLIQGGQITAALGVEANNYRPYGGSKTKIEVGNTTEIATRKQAIVGKITNTTDEIRKLRDGKSKLIQLFGKDHVDSHSLYQKICDALSQKEAQQEQLELENERLEHILQMTLHSYIKITGTMQPGILLIICGNKKLLEKPLKKISLTSDNFSVEE